MVETYIYEKDTGCEACPTIRVKRTILVDLSRKSNISFVRGHRANREEIVEYKALAHRSGVIRRYNVKRVGVFGSSSRIGQAAQAIGSIITPGNVSPYRSPIRSGIARALTPGGGRGRRPGRSNRAARCPEGYQYGGRFTDNQLSTCGAKLFDLPGPLGRAISAIQRAFTRTNITVNEPQGRAIRGTAAGNVLESRKPQIPRVQPTTLRSDRDKQTSEIIKAMGSTNEPISRLIRRDGFVLEPVVSPKVLRTIPDNRDMEDATYVMRLTSVDNLGGDELGLLSNTGVTNVTYALSNGSYVEIKKVRPLTVGERRKLGRTVNKAIETDNSKDPAARLKYLADETGDGMEYREKLPKGKNLQQMLKGGRPRKAVEKAPASAPDERRNVMTVDAAAAKIRAGEPLSSIPPSVLQQALTKANIFRRRRNAFESTGGKGYTQRASKNPNDHLNVALASEIQRYMGLDAPDVGIFGAGDNKKALVELPESIIDGSTVDTGSSLSDLSTNDVAKMLVSDLVSDITQRPRNSVAIVKKGDSVKPVPLAVDSELTDLSEIKIRERTKAQIRKFGSVSGEGLYSKYYKELKEEQRRLMQKQIADLLLRARQFNFTKYRDRLYRDGELSQSEKTHLNIVAKIIENRIEVLGSQREQLIKALGGNK